MKNTFGLMAALILGVSNVFAQTQKGVFIVGAGTSFDFSSLNSRVLTDSYESDKVKTSSFDYASRFGYFLFNNFSAGIDFISTSTTKKNDGDVSKSTTLAIGPFARLYFGEASIKPFIQSGLAFGTNNLEHDSGNVHYPDDKVKSKLSAYEAGGGISYFLARRVSLDLEVSYGQAVSKYKNFYNEDVKSTVNGITSAIGFSILL